MKILKRMFTGLLLWAGLTTATVAQPLVDVNWVAGNLDNDNVVLIDLRNKLDKGSYETYLNGHIPSSYILTI